MSKEAPPDEVDALLNPSLPWLCTDDAFKDMQARTSAMLAGTSSAVTSPAMPFTVDNGIAYMSVSDFIFGTPNLMTQHYGLTSTIENIEALAEIEADKKINGVFMDINSGGGEPAYLFDFTDMIENFSKPIVTYTPGIAASAAFAMFVAGHKAYASEVAVLGSIGVKAPKPSEWQKNYFMTSQNAKNKLGNEKQTKRLINQLESVFISRVMRATGKSHAEVVKHGREGGLLSADEARQVDFITAVADRDTAHNSIRSRRVKNDKTGSDTSATAHDRWDTLLAFAEKGVALATVQTAAKSSMSTEEAASFLETLVPAGNAGGGSGSASAGGDAGSADAGGESSLSADVATLANAVMGLVESNKTTQSLVQKIATMDNGPGGVNAPTHPDPDTGDGEDETETGATASADEVHAVKMNQIENIFGKSA